jgi:hypothetical protein
MKIDEAIKIIQGLKDYDLKPEDSEFLKKMVVAAKMALAALRTLDRMKYTYHGAELWKPPLGKPPGHIYEPDEYGKRVIYREDGVTLVSITVGGHGKYCPTTNLVWHTDEDAEAMTGDGGWLTLDEIRDQIWEREGYNIIIEVREDGPLSGVIHQTGNQPKSKAWHEQGTTRGYA